MGTALSNDNSLNFCSAHRARFSFPIIHSKIILEFAAAINPIDGGPFAANSFFQNPADRSM
jgi:hypothetical protein